jgi:hypothetical protein
MRHPSWSPDGGGAGDEHDGVDGRFPAEKGRGAIQAYEINRGPARAIQARVEIEFRGQSKLWIARDDLYVDVAGWMGGVAGMGSEEDRQANERGVRQDTPQALHNGNLVACHEAGIAPPALVIS